jgi:hypothetical protein
MTLQEFKYYILAREFQITEIGAYKPSVDDPNIKDFIINTRIDLRDTDGLNWYRELIVPSDMYGTEAHVESLEEAVTSIWKGYSERQSTSIHTCKHEQVIVLGSKNLCIHCKAKLEGKVPINLKNVN